MDLDYWNYCCYYNTLFYISLNILSISSLAIFLDIIEKCFITRMECVYKRNFINAKIYFFSSRTDYLERN